MGKSTKGVSVPSRFIPRFWNDADQRSAIAKEIKRRYEQLREDCGADCYQKDLLCQEAIFLAVQLETARVNAFDTGEIDQGVYTQMTNALLGLLKALGLKPQSKSALDLKSYLKERA